MTAISKQACTDHTSFEQMINLAPDAFFHGDPSGNLLFANDAASELTGYSREELLTMNIRELFDEETISNAPLRYDLLKSGSIVKTVRPIRRKDGARLVVEMHSKVIPDGTLESFFRNIDELKKKEAQIESLLLEKTILLKEVHHRIKNNMSTISSLLNLQAHSTEHGEVRQVFGEAVCQINTMQKIYDKLYVSSDYKYVGISEYMRELMAEVCQILGCSKRFELRLDIQDLLMESNKVFQLGIIANELVTNSSKHAFRDPGPGLVSLSLSEVDSKIRFKYLDNGPGIPGKIPSNGFGMTLISLLSQQLCGTYRIDGEKGFCFDFEFPA